MRSPWSCCVGFVPCASAVCDKYPTCCVARCVKKRRWNHARPVQMSPSNLPLLYWDARLWSWASSLDLNTCLNYSIPSTAGGPSDWRDRGRVRVNPALGHGPGREGAQGHQDHRPVVRAAELSCPGGGCCGGGWRTVLSWSAAGCPGSPPWAVHLVLPCVLIGGHCGGDSLALRHWRLCHSHQL